MKIKKVLTLAAALLMVGTAVGCGGKTSSSEEVLTADQVISEAADYLWQMYRSRDEKKITSSFDVVNKISIGKDVVSVTWSLDVTGAKGGFEVKAKDENFSTIYVGYNDYLVTEDSSSKLTATLTLGETSKTLADVFASEANKHAIDFTTPKKLLEGYAVTIKAEDYGLVKDPTPTITKEFTAKSITKEEATVKVDLKNLYYNYNAVYFGKNVADDLFTITAPENFVITKIELESYGKYDNFKFHVGADTTGAEIAKEYTTNASGNNDYVVKPNVNQVSIDNPTSNNCSFYGVTVYIQRKAILTPASLLGFAGENVGYNGANTKTTTVGGLELSYNEVGCYTNDDGSNNGLQFRIKNGNTSTIWTSKAVESGIEKVNMNIAAKKSAYDNNDAIKFEFSNNADFSDAEVIMLSTVKTSKEYTVTPSVDTYKYVRITHMLTHSGYWDSIDIVY